MPMLLMSCEHFNMLFRSQKTMTQVKVGLEIHVYPRMEYACKLFCDCPIDPEAAANTNICPVCTAQPGAKPMRANREAVVKTLALARLFNAEASSRFAFQRKHYSWPDLPAGYQRTMSGSYALPAARDGSFAGIRIEQVHLEEDPARWDPQTGRVDYNRSGVPLVEIVTAPDFTSAEQVREWLEHLRLRLDYAGCYDERFGVKADVNVSLAPRYERVEIKNINAFSAIVDAIRFEQKRQEGEERIPPQTRAWTGTETVFMRKKERAQDYHFIPEQDLPVIPLTDDLISEARELLARDPDVVVSSLQEAGVSEEDAQIIVQSPFVAEYAEYLIREGIGGRFAGAFMRREFLRVVNYAHAHPRMFAGSCEHVLALARLLAERKVSDRVGRELMERLFREDFDVDAYVAEHDLLVVGDDAFVEGIVDEVIGEQEGAVADYRAGKDEVLNFLAGQVMRKSKGKADVRRVRELLIARLGRHA